MNTPFGRSPSTIIRRLTVSTASLTLLGATLVGCSTSNTVTFSQSDRKAGMKLYEKGNYAEANAQFRKTVRTNPTDYKSQYYLGATYDQMGQTQQAIHAYKTSLDVQTTTLEGKEDKAFRANTIDGLARVIAKNDSGDTELDTIEQKARETQSGEWFFCLAKIYRYKGDADSAIDSYNRAALLSPKDFYIAKDHGLYLEQAGQTQLAIAPLKKAYAINSQDQDVNAALRRIGIVPGPGLLDESQLAKPPVPKGPIPPMNEWHAHQNTPRRATSPETANTSVTPIEPTTASPAPGPTVQAPRD